mgnify:CR=1 FL=1
MGQDLEECFWPLKYLFSIQESHECGSDPFPGCATKVGLNFLPRRARENKKWLHGRLVGSNISKTSKQQASFCINTNTIRTKLRYQTIINTTQITHAQRNATQRSPSQQWDATAPYSNRIEKQVQNLFICCNRLSTRKKSRKEAQGILPPSDTNRSTQSIACNRKHRIRTVTPQCQLHTLNSKTSSPTGGNSASDHFKNSLQSLDQMDPASQISWTPYPSSSESNPVISALPKWKTSSSVRLVPLMTMKI